MPQQLAFDWASQQITANLGKVNPFDKIHVHLCTVFVTVLFVQIRRGSCVELIKRIIFIRDRLIVTRYPSGVRLEIVGMDESNCGHWCKQHLCCSRAVTPGIFLHLQKAQIVNGKIQHHVCVGACVAL